MSEKIDKELEKKVEKIVEEKVKERKGSSAVAVLVVLLILVSLAFAGYVLIDKGIIFSDNEIKEDSKNDKAESLGLSDIRFYDVYSRLRMYTKDENRTGYKSFSSLELFAIGITDLDYSDFSATGERDNYNNPLYSFKAKTLVEKLVKYFGNDVELNKNDLVNQGAMTNVNFGGNYLKITAYDASNDMYTGYFAGAGFEGGMGPNVIDRKLVKAELKNDVITVEEKAMYYTSESENENTIVVNVYSDVRKTNKIDSISYDIQNAWEKTLSVDSYLDKSSTITSVYKFNEKTGGFYFVSSIIK